MPEVLITNVSDTARWVAAYRAWETARPDALFKDPFAARLAGERGQAIASFVSSRMHGGWPLITRTKLIDDLILASVAGGCDRVLNLAAGLDTRPYRLGLPPDLPWVEADLGPMIDEKERMLSAEKPVCRLTRERVDLADPAARGAFLERALAGARRALVVTEGLLPYLDPDVVRTLGRDLERRAEIRWWVLDVSSPAVLRMLRRRMRFQLINAPMKFGPPDGVAFFEAMGWRALDVYSMFREASRFKRLPIYLRPFTLFPDPDPRRPGEKRPWAAVVRLERPGA